MFRCIPLHRENVQWLISGSGISFDFDMVVIDELSSFKNHQTKRVRALMNISSGICRWSVDFMEIVMSEILPYICFSGNLL